MSFTVSHARALPSTSNSPRLSRLPPPLQAINLQHLPRHPSPSSFVSVIRCTCTSHSAFPLKFSVVCINSTTVADGEGHEMYLPSLRERVGQQALNKNKLSNTHHPFCKLFISDHFVLLIQLKPFPTVVQKKCSLHFRCHSHNKCEKEKER